MPKTFRRDLIILFIGKVILLAGLFLVCFSPENRPNIDAAQMTAMILCIKEKAPDART